MSERSLLQQIPPNRWPAPPQRLARWPSTSAKCVPAPETAAEQSIDRKGVVVTSLAPDHFSDLAVPQLHYHIRERGSLHAMGGHDRRRILLARQPLQQLQNQVSSRCVQIAGWFIGQQDRRTLHQCSCDRHALHLPTRELMWVTRAKSVQFHPREFLACRLSSIPLA